MKLPRDISGTELIKSLQPLGYKVTRQAGSHIRLTCHLPIPHHITIPNHNPLRVGTLAAILSEIASHLKISREDLTTKLWHG